MCARGACPAWSSGPSTLPLDVIVSRAAVLVGAFIGGGVTVLLAIYVALRLGPGVISGIDADDALGVALRSRLSWFSPGSVVYLRAPPTLLPKLQHEYPTLRLMPWARRPEDHGCDPIPGIIVTAPCLRNDFVSAELVFPMPRTAIASIGTSNSGGQLILFQLGARWYIVVDRFYVI